MSGTVAGAAIVSAISDAGIARNVNIQFEADPSTAMLTTISSSVPSIPAANDPADAIPLNLYAQITDANGNSLGSGISVNWSANNYSVFNVNTFDQTATSQTDSNGRATIPLYVLGAGPQLVSVEYNGVSKNITITGIGETITINPKLNSRSSLNVGMSDIISILFDKSAGLGYTAYVSCTSLCQDINGDDIFSSTYDVSRQNQLYIPSFVPGQEGTLKFSVRIENGPTQDFTIEVNGPPE